MPNKALNSKKKVFAPEVQYYCKDIAVLKDLYSEIYDSIYCCQQQ